MPFSPLDPLPEAPQRTDTPEDFILKADAWVAQLETFSNQLNTFIGELETAAALIAAAPAYSDPGLVALTGNTPAADRLPYYTGSGSSALATFTSLARSLLASASTGAMQTVLGLGSLATLSSINDSNWIGTDLAIANGGTGASSASTARTNLGLDPLVVPTGAVFAFAMNSAPTGYLECDGAAVSRATYADLFTAIGTTFGVGDGSTTFNLPDLRAEFVRGWDHGRGVDSGRSFGSAQADEFEAHTHTVEKGSASPGSGAFQNEATGGGSLATSSTGGTETRPRNIALLYAIKT